MPSAQQTAICQWATRVSEEGIAAPGEADPLWREWITILLQGRAEYLGRRDPTRWCSGDVRFTSPASLKHFRKATAAQADFTPIKLAARGAGESYIWSNKAADAARTRAAAKVRLRRRVTRPGRGTRTAVDSR